MLKNTIIKIAVKIMKMKIIVKRIREIQSWMRMLTNNQTSKPLRVSFRIIFIALEMIIENMKDLNLMKIIESQINA